MVKITRNGEYRATVETLDDAFIWLLKHQSQSTDWALEYEGWAAVDEETGERLLTYKQWKKLHPELDKDVPAWKIRLRERGVP